MPPSVVLEVMKILHQEMALREETRGLEQARPALDATELTARAESLALTQGGLAERVGTVTRKIRELPDGERVFGREIVLLTRVEQVMSEAQDLLQRQVTGPAAIAAETEAIELLLQSRRINPKGGGGGGGANPGGGGTGDTDESALAMVGLGDELNAHAVSRHVLQSTGAGGADLPPEFRQGLDAFFDALERSATARPD